MMRGRSGQSLVELSLLLPVLLTFLIGIVEGGFLFRNYNALVEATWIGARFALDGGSDADVVAAIQGSASGLSMDAGHADIYVVRGKTDSSGGIPNPGPNWVVNHALGTGVASTQLKTTPAELQQKLRNGLDGLANSATYANVNFILVEIDYRHTSVTGGWVIPVALPIRSYAVVQQFVIQ